MPRLYQILIIGGGPAGLSAAARAQKLGLSYLLLESASQFANTVRQYQKNKRVMDEPRILPLRSHLPFCVERKEALLQNWADFIAGQRLAIRYRCEVTTIHGSLGEFEVELRSGERLLARTVVLAIGTQGQLRHLGIPGEELPQVQYQLDDPDAFREQTIAVIGAGDSAIENALALAAHNQVILVNRRDEFPRAKPDNLEAINQAIQHQELECYFSTRPARISAADGDKPLRLTLKTPEGALSLHCDRVIARLGAQASRAFLDACDIQFPAQDPDTPPRLNAYYESSVPGLYIIGSLAGYPLIKQALNQGYEVVEYINGNTRLEAADEPLLRDKFRALPAFHSVKTVLDLIRYTMPLFAGLTRLQLREFMLESEVRLPQPGEQIFAYNDYTDTFFSIIAGEVRIPINRKDPTQIVTLRQGQFFGEMSLISGRRRSASVYAGAGQQCVLVETPRRTLLKFINSVASIKRTIDQTFMLRAIQSQIAPEIPASDLAAVVHTAQLQEYAPGELIYQEGENADSLYLIRRGSVTISRIIGGGEIILSYLAAGNYFGETGLLSDLPREETVRATVATELIRLPGSAFMALLERSPRLRHEVEARFQRHIARHSRMQGQPQAGNLIAFLVGQGLGEATDVLLIDESLCIHCNQCETACAEVHEGTSRLDRKAGPSFANIHVPTSCRHCEHPHCMKECPPDAIHRSPNGEVYIADNCIGCGQCQQNCPYGVIQMAAPKRRKPGLFAWLLFGAGPGPGRATGDPKAEDGKKAVKCDMCQQLRTGPGCVRACPTGAALRVSPEDFMSLVD